MHLNRIRWSGILLAVASIAAVTTVLAQSGGGYDASYNTFDSAGTTMSSGGYVLQTGAGQPVAGTSGNGVYSLNAGVLAGGSGAAVAAGSPAASPSPAPTLPPLPFRRFGPQVAKDGVN